MRNDPERRPEPISLSGPLARSARLALSGPLARSARLALSGPLARSARLALSGPLARSARLALCGLLGASAVPACGEEPAADEAWGEFDPAMRLSTARIRCDAGRFVGPVSIAAAGDSGPVEGARILLWDMAAGEVSDQGRAEKVGPAFTVDAAEVPCDDPATVLVVVPVNEVAYGTPELEVAQAGVLNGGGARDTTVPLTLVVSEVGERASIVTAYVHDLTGDASLTPIPLQRTAPGTWDSVWNGQLQPGYLMGALARDPTGAIIGAFGL